LWPNQLLACRERNIPAMLVNARMSAGSFAAWRRAPGLARFMLGTFRIIRARGEEDAARLRALGAVHVETPGDLKLAAEPLPVDDTELAALRARLADRPTLLAASTHPGEEALVAAAHQRIAAVIPGLLTIIVPRHPDRGPALATALNAPRRAAGQPPPESGIWIADTLGEMGLWYRLCRIALIGRSLMAPGGGQNPLEPARLGCAIIVGPHTGNFTGHIARLRAADGLVELSGPDGLADAVIALLTDPERRQAMAERAGHLAQLHADLPGRTAAALLSLVAG
jgi:3-deoxy-D-manno-octulosonic-acid transferase